MDAVRGPVSGGLGQPAPERWAGAAWRCRPAVVGAHWHGVQVRNIELRRAVFATLLRADRAVTLDELMIQLVDREGIDVAGHLAVSARQRVSDLLRWQVECGRVIRVAPGLYRVVPEALSRTTRWRCLNWRRLRDRAVTVEDGEFR